MKLCIIILELCRNTGNFLLDKLKYNDTMPYLYLNRRRFLIIINLIYKEVSNVKLSKNIAQKIVLKMMNVIPYNINVMVKME